MKKFLMLMLVMICFFMNLGITSYAADSENKLPNVIYLYEQIDGKDVIEYYRTEDNKIYYNACTAYKDGHETGEPMHGKIKLGTKIDGISISTDEKNKNIVDSLVFIKQNNRQLSKYTLVYTDAGSIIFKNISLYGNSILVPNEYADASYFVKYEENSEPLEISGYGNPDDLAQVLNPNVKGSIANIIHEYSAVIASILIFVAIVTLGINVIMNRAKAEERMANMTGIMYVAIGVIIFSVVLLLYNWLGGIVGDQSIDTSEKVENTSSRMIGGGGKATRTDEIK